MEGLNPEKPKKDPLVQSRIESDLGEASPEALSESADFLRELQEWLGRESDYDGFEGMALEYAQDAKDFFSSNKERRHIVFVLPLKQPKGASVSAGVLSPWSQTVIARQKKGRWEEGSFAMPMGKVDVKDYAANETLGRALTNAARREIEEEVSRRKIDGQYMIAGSYVDTNTNNVIHVVVEEMSDPIEGDPRKMSVHVPNDSHEHSQMGWIAVGNLEMLKPVAKGTKRALLTAFSYVANLNNQVRSARE